MNWKSMRALLAGIPALPDARCRGRAALFEATIATRGPIKAELENARSEALRLCRTCPALGPCGVWLTGMPQTRRPRGVVAGMIVTASGLPARTRTPSTAGAAAADEATR